MDYVIPFLNPQSHEGLRITHSILFSSLLPCLTILFLLRYRRGPKIIFISGVELFLASLSHIFLDLLVGVTPLPLLWPMSIYEFKLPFGVLPSAGKISLTNDYFYSNLDIEMGILLPCSILLYLSNLRPKTLFSWGLMTFLIVVAAYFIHIAYGLSR